jgi:hypothetical protein
MIDDQLNNGHLFFVRQRLQSMFLTMFHLFFSFVTLNQGYEEASVGFVDNGK